MNEDGGIINSADDIEDIPPTPLPTPNRNTKKRVKAPRGHKARLKQKSDGEERRAEFLKHFRENGCKTGEALGLIGLSMSAYKQWRYRYPEFAAEIDRIRANSGQVFKKIPWMGTFAEFGTQYLGRSLPYSWFHLLAAEAMEKGTGGSITLILWPPEHGKSSLLEDFCNYKLAVDPFHRITIGSEKQGHADKMLTFVQRRMEIDGPVPQYVKRFGPFAPVPGQGRSMSQSWSSKHFNVYKSQRSGEREFSLQSLGMTGSVIGTRCDLLGVDDPQSRNTLGQTETLLDVFRGDWLSRPGTTGHTVVNGSRQGDEDFYDALMRENIIDKLIRLPAYDEDRIALHGSPWLWPERYSEADYARLRRNAGEEAWERTYMQAPRAKADATFTEEAIAECLNPLRSVIHDPVPDIKAIYLGLDPAIGSANGITALGATNRKLYVLRCLSVPGLTRTTQIMDLLEELAHQFNLPGRCEVTDVVIESMAFQKALIEDEALQKLIERFGFRVRGHQTGLNKYDENLGVAAMARSFLRKEIDIPWADDPATRREMQGLIDELLRWRPFVKGTKLRQDRVMALWFPWILWRDRRHEMAADTASFGFKGLPYRPTSYTPSGLAVVRSGS